VSINIDTNRLFFLFQDKLTFIIIESSLLGQSALSMRCWTPAFQRQSLFSSSGNGVTSGL
jgi:hypothetical protein